ncbi:hypothetical protein RGR602_PC00618 (plasmid) [Rhizobium gallicum bv. gallicum R602sp]|uniref:Uncharacterized protein n=1 Tax=Rhizobium gallicum bv. gallicum R602sp TaxID=1041138 RepID=A0A0B4XDR8_9HYPH|nr:hypothetical protein RGR602_PC00618 [Rhizobium gallicum bv. gallicum R602sp]TDW33313.1 hypothetical protein EV128_10546 [Rhizobium azibense]
MGIDHTVGATDQRFAEPVHAKGVEMIQAAIASLEERLRHVSDEVKPLLKRILACTAYQHEIIGTATQAMTMKAIRSAAGLLQMPLMRRLLSCPNA